VDARPAIGCVVAAFPATIDRQGMFFADGRLRNATRLAKAQSTF
jgi:hypothetical protein